MADAGVVRSEGVETQVPVRVLAFAVDDGLFSLHLDWAEAVYPADAVSVHTVRSRRGGPQDFLIHGGQPAFVVDLRNLFGLRDLQGETRRGAYVVVRSGSYRLALQVDAIEGIQALDLRAHIPVGSSLVRDGGVCVASLVEHEGGILAILDPNRLLDGPTRDSLEPASRNARAFIEREEKIEHLRTELSRKPSIADLRSYARLCKRNGRSRTAAAARVVLKQCEEGADGVAAEGAERIVRALLQGASQRQDGEILVQAPGASDGRVFLSGGRIVDADFGGDYGLRALKNLLALREVECRLVAGGRTDRGDQMAGSTVATLIEALASLGADRRGRKGR